MISNGCYHHMPKKQDTMYLLEEVWNPTYQLFLYKAEPQSDQTSKLTKPNTQEEQQVQHQHKEGWNQ